MVETTLEALSREFTPVIRERGRDYHLRGAVRVAEAGAERVLAFVQGTRRYTVQVVFRGPEPAMSCTCPYFLDREEPCKHLWAVLLTLKKRGYFDDREEDHPETAERTEAPHPAARAAPNGGARQLAPALPDWEVYLQHINESAQEARGSRPRRWPAGREILYVFDVGRTLREGSAVVHLLFRDQGEQQRVRPVGGSGARLPDLWLLPDERDREILSTLRGVSYENSYEAPSFRYTLLGRSTPLLFPSYRLEADLLRLLLPKMCATGRLFLKTRAQGEGGASLSSRAVRLDGGDPWEFRLRLAEAGAGRARLSGVLRRGEQAMPLSAPDLLLNGGFLFARGTLSRYDDHGAFIWIDLLRRGRPLTATAEELPRFLDRLFSVAVLPPVDIAPSLSIRTLEAEPRPLLKVAAADSRRHSRTGGGLIGELYFDYGGQVLPGLPAAPGRFLAEERLLVVRRPVVEQAALERLLAIGFRRVYEYRSGSEVLKLAVRKLPAVVNRLLDEQWEVEAEGKLLRRAGSFSLRVSSGVDWFELHGGIQFAGREVPFPELLKALRRGSNTVRLGDGTFGILPEQWLERQGLLLEMGEVEGDHLRFRSSQALLIDLLLRSRPESSCDELFARLRDRLQSFSGIEAVEAPPGFVGRLRGYQKEGLGWFRFLDEFGFGGCLADDMGLGKTIQVLALLQALGRQASAAPRKGGGGPGPSLVVVPKSLVFNWREEAARFTPQLKVLDYTGPKRSRNTAAFRAYDAVLTTYGTMRNDIAQLKDFPFHYLILDEAQLIKNAGSATAKAARLLQGHRRLALSGTPIENHLGELWSLFEFLNPGMLGGVSFFKRQVRRKEGLDAAARGLLARYLRPFILRRTKEQVAPELPDKVEQTLFCQLEAGERRRYDELKRYYLASLQRSIEAEGLGRAKIQILEALLRLRQAACHPGLLDKRRLGRSSAKLDLLLQNLEDVLAERRKALVFSQFTSLLSILKERLDKMGVDYEYLDGRTRDRKRRVTRFQEHPECRLFLISLKAGGLGLNLTAAEYVFLLDPWWNPAAEAQAIDRTHRIGQDKKVFAYRLIAKDTVEERVLELQSSKRELAAAIINQDNRLIGKLSSEDLALLLS